MTLTKIKTDGVTDDAITSGKIPANAVGSSEIADTAVTLAKLEHGTSSNNGKFLRANNGADPSFETVTSTIINNNANNRVITGSDSADTLNSESALTFNNSTDTLLIHQTDTGNNPAFKSIHRGGAGSQINAHFTNYSGTNHTVILHDGSVGINTQTPAEKLDVIGNIKFGANSLGLIQEDGANLVFKANAAAKNAHIMTHDGNEDINLDPSGFIQFETAGSEAMRLTSSGTVNIGGQTTQTAHSLSVNKSNGNCIQVGNTSGSSAGSHDAQIVASDGTNFNNLKLGGHETKVFANVSGGTGYTETWRFDSSGNLACKLAGKGIDFSADGNASGNTSELLDDYEEGSWSATTLNYDYDANQAQRGHYIKVGRVVHAFFRVKFHNQSTHVGNHLRFTGLPFTAASGNPYDVGLTGFAGGYSSIDFFRIYVQPGSAYAYWYTSTGNAFDNSTSLNGADVRGCITYTAA